MTRQAEAALEPFARLADEIERTAALYSAPANDPTNWAKSCAWADLVRAREALAALRATPPAPGRELGDLLRETRDAFRAASTEEVALFQIAVTEAAKPPHEWRVKLAAYSMALSNLIQAVDAALSAPATGEGVDDATPPAPGSGELTAALAAEKTRAERVESRMALVEAALDRVAVHYFGGDDPDADAALDALSAFDARTATLDQ